MTVFLAVSIALILAFLLASNSIVKGLAQQEKERMDIWANATQKIAQANVDSDFEFLLSIISQNNTIPVMVADAKGDILDFRNFPLPDKETDEKQAFQELSPKNRDFLKNRLLKATKGASLQTLSETNPHFIRVDVAGDSSQYIFFEDSILLHRLSLYPYIQIAVTVILALILYIAVAYTKRAEQNRVWAGLSKETAHQLGTPISSLMAWNEFLKATGAASDVTAEIEKDVNRLSVIAQRFSKIGSRPELELEYLNSMVERSICYMRNRISGKVETILDLSPEENGVELSPQLFEWVMENLMKNAVDAMEGAGTLTISTGAEKGKVWIEIKDTGKGIARRNFKNIFSPGFTTKKRGWGLGLTLVKRIVEEYHCGRIFVKESELGKGTVFRIELPALRTDNLLRDGKRTRL